MQRVLLFSFFVLAFALSTLASSVADISTLLAMSVIPTDETGRVDCTIWTDGTNTLSLPHGLRKAEYNGRTIWLNAPCEPDMKYGLSVAKEDCTRFLAPIVKPLQVFTNKLFCILIDPGHGDTDGGAISQFNGLREKDFVLDVSLRVGDILTDKGFDVFLSRDDDTFISLSDRGEIAKEVAADAFVSIHANYAVNKSARGAETYIMPLARFEATAGGSTIGSDERAGNKWDSLNASLGYSIHKHLPGRLAPDDRGLKHARFQVLRQAPCPAVLIECGFLSNVSDALNLASNWYRDRLAESISAGIMEFAERHVRVIP